MITRESALSKYYPAEKIYRIHKAVEQKIYEFINNFPKGVSNETISSVIYEKAFNFMKRPSKRLRPLLFLLSYELFSEKSDLLSPEVLSAAISLEISHTSILIHDDIIDSSETRGSVPCVHKALDESGYKANGTSAAILVGDALSSLSLSPIIYADLPEKIKLRLINELSYFTIRTAEGQADELILSNTNLEDITEDLLKIVYQNKTGSTSVECPIIMGLVLANNNNLQIRKLIGSWSSTIGFAFQIMNDLTEYRITNKNTNKRFDDIIERKKNWIVIQAWSLGNQEVKEILENYFDKKNQQGDAYKIYELIKNGGAIIAAENKIKNLFYEAYKMIEKSNIDQNIKEKLFNLQALLSELYKQGSIYSSLGRKDNGLSNSLY